MRWQETDQVCVCHVSECESGLSGSGETVTQHRERAHACQHPQPAHLQSCSVTHKRTHKRTHCASYGPPAQYPNHCVWCGRRQEQWEARLTRQPISLTFVCGHALLTTMLSMPVAAAPWPSHVVSALASRVVPMMGMTAWWPL